MNHNKTSFFYSSITFVLLYIITLGNFLILPKEVKSRTINQNNIRVSNEILVKYKDEPEVYVFKIAQSDDFYFVLDTFNNNKNVEYAEPNYLYEGSIVPTDSYFTRQWYLEKIKAPETWNKTRDTSNITIAILDSGVQIDHPDLRDNIWSNISEAPSNSIDDDKNGFIDDKNGWDFVNNVSDPSPKFKEGFTEAGILHGTIVAGIAAASGNNATGITGVTWNSKIMPLKVLGDAGEGKTSDVIKAIDYAIANGADIINFSFVGFGYSQSLDRAIKRAYDAGIIIVAAAGNEQEEGSGYSLDTTPMYPACHDGENGENRVIGVAATDTLDQKADFSSYGYDCVDIAAPGLSIYSTIVYSPSYKIDEKYFNKYYDGYWSGTSMATPMVSAGFALVESVNPSLSRDELVDILLNSADNINRLNPSYVNQLGTGRLNLYAAVSGTQNKLKTKSINLLIAPYSDYSSVVKKTNEKGEEENEIKVYGDNFRGGINIASGDIDGNGSSEIITGAGFGGGPHIRIFNQDGSLVNQFFAYDTDFRGGVNVASCDIDDNGSSEIITGSGFGGRPEVRVFNRFGESKGKFFAYNPNFTGGVYVACGDVDGDGQDEIVTGTGRTGGPQIRIFDKDGNVEGQFFAYDKNFRGGVKVSLGNVYGGVRNNKLEIITAPGPGGGPHVRIFDNYANVKGQFFAYNNNFRGGVNLAAGDIDSDGLAEIITGAGPGGTPHVRVFEQDGKFIESFFAYENKFSGGVNIGIIKN